MATKHRRIAVTEDPELAEALRRSAAELPGLSDAGLVKELALRGARTLPVKASEQRMDRIIARTGAWPTRGNVQDYLRAKGSSGDPDPEEPDRGSRILDQLREDRV